MNTDSIGGLMQGVRNAQSAKCLVAGREMRVVVFEVG